MVGEGRLLRDPAVYTEERWTGRRSQHKRERTWKGRQDASVLFLISPYDSPNGQWEELGLGGHWDHPRNKMHNFPA